MNRPDPASLRLLDELKSHEQLRDGDWRELGFRDVTAVKAGCAALAAQPALSGTMAAHLPQILRSAARSSAPDQAFAGLQRWLEESAGNAHAFADWNTPRFLDILAELFAATPALSEYLIHYPERTRAIIDAVLSGQVSRGSGWRRLLAGYLAGGLGVTMNGHAEQLAVLRRYRVESMLQVAALDLAGLSGLRDIVRALSDMADACVDAALHIAMERLKPRMGVAPPVKDDGDLFAEPAQPFVVFALGKLGGRELNYSSDIDLVFTHAGSGETIETNRPVDVQTYFTALGEEVIAILDKVTEDGRVYRVDLRLRPHGTAGPLVRSTPEMLNYYQTEGRTWERQAWLKARPVAGDLALGNKFLNTLAPFVYRRYLSLDAIGDLKALKRQIEMSVAKRGETADEVKLGHGGIRDVEFTVQFMQLLHGSEHIRARGGNTLTVLEELRREGLLSAADVEPLMDSYVFLRNVEHRLQLHGDQQTHKLPTEPAVRRRIALSLGYTDKASGEKAVTAQDAFENDRLKHTSRTRAVFERLFANLFSDSKGVEAEISDMLLAPQPDFERLAAQLPQYGFTNAEASAHELVELSRESFILTAPSRTRKYLASIAPNLLKTLAATGEADEALRRFSRIVGSLGAKAVFYQMLHENPWLLKMAVDLAASSEFLTDILVANPGLFDELVDALQTKRSKTAKEMFDELHSIASGGDISDTLRAYRAGELLRIGVRDLIHEANVEQTQTELSDLAEAILRTQLQQTVKAHKARRGEVKDANGAPVEFAIIALGKFGGREMNYGSDLDVLFFYGDEGQTADGLPAGTYFGELAQDLIRTMKTPTALGSLYELDARLRPFGNKGPLALAPEAFKRSWQAGELADWERLALTRARFAAGDTGVGERALHTIRSAIYTPLQNVEALRQEVASMRKRLEENTESDDIKRGRGGLMDIEFIAQYLQLVHGPAFPPLRQANTDAALRALLKFKKLPDADGETLLAAYQFLMRMENRLRIVHGLSSHRMPQKPDALRKLALRTGYADAAERAEAQLRADYQRYTTRVREIFNSIAGG